MSVHVKVSTQERQQLNSSSVFQLHCNKKNKHLFKILWIPALILNDHVTAAKTSATTLEIGLKPSHYQPFIINHLIPGLLL